MAASPRPRMSEQEKAAIIDGYLAGMPIRYLMRSLGRSYGGIHNVLRDAQVPMRPPGSQQLRTARKGLTR